MYYRYSKSIKAVSLEDSSNSRSPLVPFKKDDNYYGYKYYKSEDWLERTKMLIEDADYKCEKCKRQFNRRGLVLHHKNYDYKPHQEPDDILQCLCKSCHHVIHETQSIINGHKSECIGADYLHISPDKEEEIMALFEKYASWLADGEKDFLKVEAAIYNFLDKEPAKCRFSRRGRRGVSARERIASKDAFDW